MQKTRKAVALLLVLLLIVTAWPMTRRAEAAGPGSTENKMTAAYFLVKETSDGEWLTKYNYIHFLTIDGTKHPAYCVESSRTNPPDGAGYSQMTESGMGYSDTARKGLKEIVRAGYPYTTTINGTSLGAEQAQAATQMAIRMWLSYRKDQEGASYNVSGMYNPEPKAGNVRIKAGTVSGAADVYNAAISLFRLAKSGQSTSFTVAASGTGDVIFPGSTDEDYYRVTLFVSMTNCDYAKIQNLPEDVSITGVSSGTADKIKNGAVVKLKVPASYSGKTLQFTLTGYSTKGELSLQYYQMTGGSSTYQRLFVPVPTEASVTASGITFPLQTFSKGSLEIRKSDAATGAALSGAEFTLYEWSEAAGRYVLSPEYTIREFEMAELYKVDDILYTLDNMGKIRVVETKAPEGYSNIDPATGAPYAWEKQFTNDGEVHTITIDAKNSYTRVEISKTSLIDGTELAGATLQIIDASGKVVKEWVTDGTKTMIEAELVAGATYTLKETAAPDGYVLANEVTFTVNSDGTVTKVSMQDDYTKIMIKKIVK